MRRRRCDPCKSVRLAVDVDTPVKVDLVVRAVLPGKRGGGSNLPMIDSYQLTWRIRLNGDQGAISGKTQKNSELRVVIKRSHTGDNNQNAEQNRMDGLSRLAGGSSEGVQRALEPSDR